MRVKCLTTDGHASYFSASQGFLVLASEGVVISAESLKSVRGALETKTRRRPSWSHRKTL